MKTELIYQDETSNKFWNIVIKGKQYTVTYGRVGTAGTSKTKEFADEAAASKDGAKLIAAKKKKGYSEAAEKAKVVRDDYTLAGKPIKDFGSTIDPATAVKLLSGYDDELKVVHKLDKLAKLPNVSEMDTLVIGAWQEAHEELEITAILEKLIEYKSVFSGLKHLFIGDMGSEECELSWINQADYSNFYQHFQALETFGLRGGENLKLGKINLPNLKNLIIETGGMDKKILQDVIASDLKNLEHLELWLGTDEYGCTIEVKDLKPILDGNYSNLKFLGLKNYYLQDELAKGFSGAAILKQIETLELSMGILKDEGAEALHANDDLLNLKHINCQFHYISEEWQKKLKTKFAAQNINLEEAEVAEEYDDETYYYVAIGE